MIVAVQGTKNFDDYNIFMRAMSVALSHLPEDDNKFYIYSAGPARVNSMVSEFSNLSERGMRARGRKIKFFKVAPSWLKENIDSIGYFAFLSTPNDQNSALVAEAELHNVEVGIYKY